MDGFMITAAQIICIICMLVPAAVLVIGKLSKRISEIKPFFAGLGICVGICLITLFVLPIGGGFNYILIFLLALLLCLHNAYRCEFYTPVQTISFYLGTMQFASLICTALSLISLAELSEGHGAHCDCYYERRGELGSAEQYIISALIRAVIVCLMILAIKKISTAEKFSEFKQAAVSALISTVLCVPIEMLIIWA